MVTPSSYSPTTYSCTQEAIESVKKELNEFRTLGPQKMVSERQLDMEMNCKEVTELKREVIF